MVVFLYPHCTGLYVFDEQFSLKEHVAWKNPLELMRGTWLPEELSLLKKYQKENIVLIGEKEEQKEGVAFSQDIEKLAQISGHVLRQKSAIREFAIKTARRNIREGFRKDILVVQAINCMDELDKVANLLMRRLREWYGWYNPEFSVESDRKFCELIIEKTREQLYREIRVKESMGATIGREDLEEIRKLAGHLITIYELQEKQLAYLDHVLQGIAPNLQIVAGTLIGAKLLALAGNLHHLSEMPSSTLQVLGAEKAMFRHLKTGAKGPRFGVISQHALVLRAKEKEKGRIARVSADKLSIAAKVDYFKGKPIGEKLKKELEKRFGAY